MRYYPGCTTDAVWMAEFKAAVEAAHRSDFSPSQARLKMTASNSTIENVLRVVLRHVNKDTAKRIMTELKQVKGNRSFTETIVALDKMLDEREPNKCRVTHESFARTKRSPSVRPK